MFVLELAMSGYVLQLATRLCYYITISSAEGTVFISCYSGIFSKEALTDLSES